MKKLITLICVCLLMVSSVNISYAFDWEKKKGVTRWNRKSIRKALLAKRHNDRKAAKQIEGPLPYDPDHSVISGDIVVNDAPEGPIVIEHETAMRKEIEQKKSEKLPEGIVMCGQMAVKKEVLPQPQK